MRTRESRAPLECQFVNSELMKMEAISLALFLFLFVIELFLNLFKLLYKESIVAILTWSYQSQPGRLFREALQNQG